MSLATVHQHNSQQSTPSWIDQSRKLGLEEVIIVMDLAIYAKAQYIVWIQSGEFSDVVLRMGTFHTVMTFISVISKRFGGGCLSDLLIESSTMAAGSISWVLEGRQYNRAMRAHNIVMEAMQRLLLRFFKEWLEENDNDVYKSFTEVLDIVFANLSSAYTQTAMLASQECKRLLEIYDEFCRNDRGKLAAFWDSYITLVCMLLDSHMQHERATGVCTSTPSVKCYIGYLQITGPTIPGKCQLCPVYVSLLVRNCVVAADPPLLHCFTCGRTVCSPAKRQQCIRTHSSRSDNLTDDEQGFEDKGWYCLYQRIRSALDPNSEW